MNFVTDRNLESNHLAAPKDSSQCDDFINPINFAFACWVVNFYLLSGRYFAPPPFFSPKNEYKPQQDPVSTMQVTGRTIYSSFLVMSYLEKGYTLDVNTGEQSTNIFVWVLVQFRHGDDEQTNNRVILVQACSWPIRRQSFAINQQLWLWKLFSVVDSVSLDTL